MPSLKNLKMAYAVSVHQHITIRESFFFTKVIYTPTQSPVHVIIKEYSPVEGNRLIGLLSLPADKVSTEIQLKGKPASSSNGHYRLEACLSEDRQFCALQVFRYSDFMYNAVCESLFYEGNDAMIIAQIL